MGAVAFLGEENSACPISDKKCTPYNENKSTCFSLIQAKMGKKVGSHLLVEKLHNPSKTQSKRFSFSFREHSIHFISVSCPPSY